MEIDPQLRAFLIRPYGQDFSTNKRPHRGTGELCPADRFFEIDAVLGSFLRSLTDYRELLMKAFWGCNFDAITILIVLSKSVNTLCITNSRFSLYSFLTNPNLVYLP